MLAQIKQSYFALARQQIKCTDAESIWLMLLRRPLDCEQKPMSRLCDIWGQSSQTGSQWETEHLQRKDSESLSHHFTPFCLFSPFSLSLFTSQFPLSLSLLFPWRIKIAAGNKRCRPRSSAHVLTQEPSFIHSFDLDSAICMLLRDRRTRTGVCINDCVCFLCM